MLDSLSNIIKVKELRNKLLFTAGLLVVYRLGKFIPVPGIDVLKVNKIMADLAENGGALGKIMSMADMFTGGALMSGAIFGLGIMPYITASIIFQLLAGIVPSLERLQREGPTGRKKLTQLTRLSTVVLCIFQALMICIQFVNQRVGSPDNSILLPESVLSSGMFIFYGVVALTAGTMFLMWLGEQIDEFGIGNGVSLLIMAGIISELPYTIGLVAQEINFSGQGNTGSLEPLDLAMLLVLFVGMVLAVVLITLGQRRIPVHQAKATRGRRVYGGGRSFLPLRVNQSGVIPIIFASALLMLPQWLLGAISDTAGSYLGWGQFWYMVTYVLLIVFFCYFYTAVTFNPNEMADNLKQGGSYVPGIRPGKKTAEYLERIMTRIALAGAIFLSFVAVMPPMVSGLMGIPAQIASFLGGTGLLIVVGVALDVVQRVEGHLLSQNYDGFVKGKTIRGRKG